MKNLETTQSICQTSSDNLSLRMKFLMIGVAVFWLGLVASTWANAEPSGDLKEENSEYNFSWLDPDKKIYVLQNRKYLKTGHPVLSVMGGLGFSNPYRNTLNVDPRLAYYFNETWGIEFFYTMTSNSENNTIQSLGASSPNALPELREIRAVLGGMIHFVPWYAKINVFDSILYFDWYFGAGVGQVQSYIDTRTRTSDAPAFVQDNPFAIVLSTGHLYHLSQSWVFRMELTDTLYQGRVNGLTGDSAWYSNLNFGIGLGWRI